MRLISAVSCVLLGLVASGCAKLEPDYVNQRVNDSLRTHLVGLAEGVAAAGESETAMAVVGWLQGEEPSELSLTRFSGEEPSGDSSILIESRAAASMIADWLEEHVFNEHGVESKGRGKVTYRLRPETVCRYEDDGVWRTDADCSRLLAKMPVRFVVSRGKHDALVVEVQVGGEPMRPLELEVHESYLTLAPDLGELLRVVKKMAEAMDDALDDSFSLTGSFALTIARGAGADYSVSLSILRKIDLVNGARADHDHVRVRLAPAEDALSALLSGGSTTFSVALEEMNVSVARDLVQGEGGYWVCPDDSDCWLCDPDGGCEWICGDDDDWDCWLEEPEVRLAGVFDLFLSGLSGSLSSSPEADSISISKVGIGDRPLTVSLEQAPILVVDVNEHAGRRFDMSIAEDDGDLLVGFSPSMELRVRHDLSGLSDDSSEPIADWLRGGFTSVKLDGSSPLLRIFQFEDYDEGCQWVCDDDECWACDEDDWDCEWICDDEECWICDDDDGYTPGALLKVERGELTLDAEALASPVVVEAPLCLVEADDDSEDEHPFSMLAPAPCE